MRRKYFPFLLLFFGLLIYTEVQARTAIVAYGSRSRSPSGAYQEWAFNDPAIGGGFRFGMNGRFSFGLDYMKQKMEGATEHHVGATSDALLGMAELSKRDISAWGLTPGVVLGSWDDTESIFLHSLTGIFYVSFWPNPGSRWIVEPLVGFIGGVGVAENRSRHTEHYDPVVFEIIDYIEGEPGHSYMLGGYGDYRETGLHSIKPLGGMEVALNFCPLRNFLITSGVRYLYNYGLDIRTGFGLAF